MEKMDEYFQDRFNEIIDEYKDPEMTLDGLVRDIGISYTIFKDMKNFGILPSCRALMKLADYFNISMEYLLARTDIDDFEKSHKNENFKSRFATLQGSATYAEIGKQTNINPYYFSTWKEKNYIPALNFLIILSEYYGVSIDFLLGRTDIEEVDYNEFTKLTVKKYSILRPIEKNNE